MEWYEVKNFEDCEVEYIYDKTVNELMKSLRDAETVAVQYKDTGQLEIIRKHKMNIMSLAIPRIVIKHK
jgi:hypothetical protein